MKDIKHVLRGYLCSNNDGNKWMSFGRKLIKVRVFFAREEKRTHSFGISGRTKGELSGVMRMSRLWRSGDFLSSDVL